ncbi:DUF4062 domain-containing protein [Mycobacterium sp. 48b]|uniref:DUF4062 domain-containing protein n=1 Tax=Mycobacterium sp. 48b TaxID=3400426 RepID=UPI003AAC621E
MKVFISSVTYALKEERAALVPFLRLLDHHPLRFEDFTAQDRSSREACLAGVEAADVYVLLLGPRYGQPFPDTGLSPTAEEFKRARQRGIPILVFNKLLAEEDDTEQSDFKDQVGHYVSGRFWRSFTDPLSCNQAVGESLKELDLESGPVERSTPRESVNVPWLAESGILATGSNSAVWSGQGGRLAPPFTVAAPILELHVVGLGGTDAPSRRQLEDQATHFARDARSAGFVSEADQLVIGGTSDIGWAIRPPGTTSSGSSLSRRSVEKFRGLVCHRSGVVGAFMSLDSDLMGSLVDQRSLQTDLAELFGLMTPHMPKTEFLSVAAGLNNASQVWEGNPASVGDRNSGRMRIAQGVVIRVGGDFAVPGGQLSASFGDVGKDLAHDLLTQLRENDL